MREDQSTAYESNIRRMYVREWLTCVSVLVRVQVTNLLLLKIVHSVAMPSPELLDVLILRLWVIKSRGTRTG